jgi:tight adherence protein B
MSPLIVTFIVALVPSFCILLYCTRPATASKSAQQRLRSIQHSIQLQDVGWKEDELEDVGGRDYTARLADFLERFEFSKSLEMLLLRADSSMNVGGVVLLSAGVALGCGLLCFAFTRVLVITGVATLAGAMIPCVWLRMKRDRRLQKFIASLPDAIDLMARSLRAGHSMNSSIELIAEQSPKPLASEFEQVYKQQRLGLQFRDALLQMGVRIPSRDLQFLITAILVQKETGGDLTEILDRTAQVIRERVRIHGEVRTRTAQGRLTGWILGLLPVFLLVVINVLNPGYSDLLFHDPTGQKMLYGGAILILLGGLTIRKIVDVEV